MLRRTFVVLSTPLRKVFGHLGTVLGAFFLSGVLHDWCMWGMGKGTSLMQTGGFFMGTGLGVLPLKLSSGSFLRRCALSLATIASCLLLSIIGRNRVGTSDPSGRPPWAKFTNPFRILFHLDERQSS